MSVSVHEPFCAPRVKVFCSLDCGQSNDRSAMGILFRTISRGAFDSVGFRHLQNTRFDFRQLIRWPVGTTYPDVVSRVADVMEKLGVLFPNYDVELLFDRTGVGRAVGDLLRARLLPRRRLGGAGGFRLVPVTISGGDVVHSRPDGLSVPKRDLIAATVVLFQSSQLAIADRLEEREILIRELVNFRVRVTAAGSDSYGNDGKLAKHDDCVTVLSLAAWGAQRDRRPGGYVGGTQPLPNISGSGPSW